MIRLLLYQLMHTISQHYRATRIQLPEVSYIWPSGHQLFVVTMPDKNNKQNNPHNVTLIAIFSLAPYLI